MEAASRTFARTVLSGLQPGALLITGDLIDAKTRLGRGQQWEEEWQVSILQQYHLHIKAASISAADDYECSLKASAIARRPCMHVCPL